IPFEKEVPAGFNDPGDDVYDKDRINYRRQTRADLDGPRRDRQEADARKKDRDKLKKRRAEENPESIFNKPADKKRSKLVLPSPQISDRELEQIVKVGKASETARETAESTGENGASSTLLSDYTFQAATAGAGLRTPRTPATNRDTVTEEALNLLALNNVETPLKGGLNTPLHDVDFQGVTPRRQVTQTPNTVLGTPATQRAITDGMTPGNFTPRSAASATPGGASIAGQTPYRDRLNINESDLMEGGSSSATEIRHQLRKSLKALPRPRNDYEIVAPDDEDDAETVDTSAEWVEDASDVDEKRRDRIRKQHEAEWKRQSHAVQRELPRPVDVNDSILRPTSQISGDLQKAEELVKREMLLMLHYDCLFNPTN
uniref:Pre-mRNA splicing factor component Cdc5p/Cef1 C-terminal domain-containing protein n=1 Tax=Plectus sambesii TaxID=2011161 RepID=A0A914USF7_9BILA